MPASLISTTQLADEHSREISAPDVDDVLHLLSDDFEFLCSPGPHNKPLLFGVSDHPTQRMSSSSTGKFLVEYSLKSDGRVTIRTSTFGENVRRCIWMPRHTRGSEAFVPSAVRAALRNRAAFLALSPPLSTSPGGAVDTLASSPRTATSSGQSCHPSQLGSPSTPICQPSFTGGSPQEEDGAVEDCCAICLGLLTEAPNGVADQWYRLTSCGHGFHTSCIIDALRFDPKCPLCRDDPSASSRDDQPRGSSSDQPNRQYNKDVFVGRSNTGGGARVRS